MKALMMKKVLILGAGMVAGPIISYLLDNGYFVTVASNTPDRADELINGKKNSKNIFWSADDDENLDKMVAEHDIAVSLLPYAFHVKVAKVCIKHKKHMVTTSYVKPEMKELDSAVKEAGIVILNELGLDPGIDHMSAKRIIDDVHNRNGKIEEFFSICGALVAPESKNNPFNYKFSWAPKGVVMAGNNDGNFLWKGNTKYVPTEDLFKNPFEVDFPEVGKLEVYPNRDSVPYIDLYEVPETKTIFRGTFRYDRWCGILDSLKKMKLISYDKFDMTGMSYRDLVAKLIDVPSDDNILENTAKFIGVEKDSYIIEAIEWLGLFSDKKMDREEDNPFEVTSDLMLDKMMMSKGERDMVVMQHTFVADFDGKKEVIRSRMLDFGDPEGDSSIARTVALPAACGVEMILEGKISITGVYIPVIPEIYNPILDKLETMGIKMTEEFGLPLSENIG